VARVKDTRVRFVEARGGPLGGKLLVVFLWDHDCGSSKTMGEITYPDGVVQA
jgi:hypothetical protein